MCISETICSAVCKALWCDVCEREKKPNNNPADSQQNASEAETCSATLYTYLFCSVWSSQET